MRLGILGSTRGSNLQSIIDAIANRHLSATITTVISNKADAGILERARTQHLSVEHIDASGLTRENYDAKVSAILNQHEVDLIVLTGYMRILSAEFVQTWQKKIINVHPSLLPAFAGLMDLAVHEAVLSSNVKETGCTVHYVTEEVDAGPVILQKKCLVQVDDTAVTLKQRVQALEGVALVEAIRLLQLCYPRC